MRSHWRTQLARAARSEHAAGTVTDAVVDVPGKHVVIHFAALAERRDREEQHTGELPRVSHAHAPVPSSSFEWASSPASARPSRN